MLTIFYITIICNREVEDNNARITSSHCRSCIFPHEIFPTSDWSQKHAVIDLNMLFHYSFSSRIFSLIYFFAWPFLSWPESLCILGHNTSHSNESLQHCMSIPAYVFSLLNEWQWKWYWKKAGTKKRKRTWLCTVYSAGLYRLFPSWEIEYRRSKLSPNLGIWHMRKDGLGRAREGWDKFTLRRML